MRRTTISQDRFESVCPCRSRDRCTCWGCTSPVLCHWFECQIPFRTGRETKEERRRGGRSTLFDECRARNLWVCLFNQCAINSLNSAIQQPWGPSFVPSLRFRGSLGAPAGRACSVLLRHPQSLPLCCPARTLCSWLVRDSSALASSNAAPLAPLWAMSDPMQPRPMFRRPLLLSLGCSWERERGRGSSLW